MNTVTYTTTYFKIQMKFESTIPAFEFPVEAFTVAVPSVPVVEGYMGQSKIILTYYGIIVIYLKRLNIVS